MFHVNKLTVKEIMINKYYEIYSPVFNINKVMVKKIIKMCIHHAPTNTVSAHMTHINLNMIYYTYIVHSPRKTTHSKHHTERQT